MMETTSFDTPFVSTTNNHENDEKDISKVFSRLRAHLHTKEKELLELQRADPSLLALDSAQIDTLIGTITSLHLSTTEGDFALASVAPSDATTFTSICSTGVDSIKVWPSTVWLPDPISNVKQEEEQNTTRRLPMITHLFSLPINAYIASSSSPTVQPPSLTPVENENQPSNRLPVVNQLLSMPINTFVSSSSVPTPKTLENNKNTIANITTVPSTTAKSVLNTETIYSKEYWLRQSSPHKSPSEPIPFDLDAHIEECSAKMRRLHTEYLAALGKIEASSNSVDCSQSINSMYPQVFDRTKTSMSNLARFLPSNK